MKGYLEMAIIRSLKSGGKTGYMIRKEIMNRTGKAVSYGSLYPALRRLEDLGLVKRRDAGRGNAYFLTERGRKKLEETARITERVLDEMRTLSAVLREILEIPISDIECMLSPDFRFHPEIGRMLKELARISRSGGIERARKVLKDAIAELRRIGE